METDAELMQRLRKYLQEQKEAKERCKQNAKRSFEFWLKATIEKVARAFGCRVTIAKEKIGHVWVWLVS